MKRIINAFRFKNEIRERQVSAAHSRFSYLDNVLDEEYGDGLVYHFPHVNPEVKKKKNANNIMKKMNDFFSKIFFLGIMYAIFAYYFIIQGTLQTLKFVR